MAPSNVELETWISLHPDSCWIGVRVQLHVTELTHVSPRMTAKQSHVKYQKWLFWLFFGLIIVHTYNYCSWNLQWKLCPDNALSRLAKILYPLKSLASSYTRNVLIAAPRISWPLQKHAKKSENASKKKMSLQNGKPQPSLRTWAKIGRRMVFERSMLLINNTISVPATKRSMKFPILRKWRWGLK